MLPSMPQPRLWEGGREDLSWVAACPDELELVPSPARTSRSLPTEEGGGNLSKKKPPDALHRLLPPREPGRGCSSSRRATEGGGC